MAKSPLDVRLYRSSVKGRRPQPVDMAYGDLAINYNHEDPALVIKGDDNVLIEFKPGHGVSIGATAPSAPKAGDLWWDTASARLFLRYGAAWVDASPAAVPPSISSALTYKGPVDPTAVGSAPAAPAVGDTYVASKAGTAAAGWTGLAGSAVSLHELLVWDGTQWDGAGAAATPRTAWQGDVDPTVAKPGGFTAAAGDLIRISKAGAVHADWGGVSASAQVGDVYLFDGRSWRDVTTEAWRRNGTVITPAVAGDLVDAVCLPQASATVRGAVLVADAAAITAGTSGAVVDAAQLKAAVAAGGGTGGAGGLSGLTGTAPIAVTGNATNKVVSVGAATTGHTGVVQLADSAAIQGGTAERVVDAKQLKDTVVLRRSGTKLTPSQTGDLLDSAALPVASASALGGIKIGTNLSIDADGKVSAQLTSALIFRGTKDPATAAPINPVTGDVWVMSKTGVMSASWTGLAGTSAQVHDLAVWDGAEWDLMGPAVATTVHTVTGTAPLHASGTTTVTLTVDDASEAAKGVVQLATAAETTAGTDGSRAVTPAGLKAASPWRRTGTEIATTASGDSVYLTGMLKIGGTSANPAVDISTGSPSAMLTRTADGKIGVGTHNPETMFHLLSGTRGVLTVSPSSDPAAAGEYAAIRFRSIVSSYGAQNYSEIVGYNDTPGVHTNALKFLVRGVSSAVLVDAMRLDSAGNLVLGGTLPAAPNIKLGADGLGTFANGLRVGKTGTSTTVQTVPLQITNSSKWQRMGLTCAGGEIKFMTDDNESGAPISPTFSFKNKLGAEFLHVDCNTGDLLLGGTPPAAPNIALKANGSIVANTDGLVYDATTKRLGIGIADPNYYSNEFVVYGSSPTYAGSASFVNDSAAADSTVQRQGFLSQAGGTAAGISVWQNSFIVEGQAIGGLALGAYNSAGAIKFYTGALRTEHARITPAGDFLFGGTLPAAPNIALKADGSIVANTDGLVYDATTKRLGIGIADPNYYSNEFVVYGSSPTYAGSASFVNDSAAADSIVQRQGFLSQAGGTAAGISVWQNSFIVEGQAIGGLALGAYNSAGAIKFYTGGFRTEHARITPAGDFLFGGTLPAAPNIALKADGNIRAKGAVSRVYADNAAAKAGGLVAGDVYRKADGTLMITF